MRFCKKVCIVVLFILYFGQHAFAQTILNDDTLQSRIDQLFIIGFRGQSYDGAPELARALRDTNLGGIILFDYDTPTKKYIRNIKTTTQVKKLIVDAQKNAKTKLFISIDEEGGLVSRLKTIPGYVKTPSAKVLGTKSNAVVTSTAVKLGGTLVNLGFNMDFAPVLDIGIDPRSPAIAKVGRAYGTTASVVSTKAIAFAQGLRVKGVVPVGKHFPGHGSAIADSHLGFTDITNTYKQSELEPFRKACAGGVPAIMVGHLFNATVDPIYPATLSSAHIQILKDIGCTKALVVSDDMDMRAITDSFGREQAYIRAISAGVDVLILSNNITTYDTEEYFTARKILFDAVKRGDIPESRITEAYTKVMALKKEYKLVR